MFPRDALARLRMQRCPQCNEPHARARCPSCRAHVAQVPTTIHGRLRWQPIAPSAVALASYECTATTPIALDGAALYRPGSGPLAPARERIGNVLAGLTRAWVGRALGVGFYRAGGYARGLVFRPARGPLDDRVALPAIRGQLIAAHATLGDDRAWLWLTCALDGKLITTCTVIASDARVLATCDVSDASWLPGISGACAASEQLFVPTDDGVARVELVHHSLAQTRAFPETAPLIAAGDRLALHATGLDAIRRHDAIRLQLT